MSALVAKHKPRFAECGEESETGEGWFAFLTVDNEAVVCCAECAEREFGCDPCRPLNRKT